METLTPVQRVITVAIGLFLTIAVVVFVLPWAGQQIAARLPPTKTPLPATATPLPTATATHTPTPAPTPTVVLTRPPAQVLLEPMPHEFQTQGNNGPASLGIVMRYWGYTDTQVTIAPIVRPGELGTDVELSDLSEYAQSRGLDTHVSVNGSIETLRELMANDFPVLIGRWLTTTEETVARHYQVLRGYDHLSQTFTLSDSWIGPEVTLSYTETDRGWQAHNRPYLLVFPADERDRVRMILGSDWDETTMWQNALDRAERELEAEAQDAFAWLNQASALAALGQYEEARASFDKARAIGLPAGVLWYRFRFYECLIGLEAYGELLALTQEAIADGITLKEVHLYRAQAYVALGDATKARAEYQRALQIHPAWEAAEEGLTSLPE